MPNMLLPERLGGQGLDSNQEESGNRAIHALLRDEASRQFVDLVITYRDQAYEVWAERGAIRFRRELAGDEVRYEILETIGENPVGDQRHTLIATIDEEIEAAAASARATGDPNLSFVEPDQLSYPHAFERIAQLFDSPNAPDLIVSPRCYAFGLTPGQHGALDIVQSRAPLAFAGPRVRPGRHTMTARHVDIAPTVCALMGFPFIDGMDATGRTSTERGREPDVYLKRQDGRVLTEIIDDSQPAPERAYLIVYDGLSHSELRHLLDTGHPCVRNLRRILDRAALSEYGSIVNFPSITWPSHSTILTGAWCGHHDIVNPGYFLRDRGEAVAPQAMGMMTESFLGGVVETLYEAFARVRGENAVTASIHEPQGRGARHAPLERRLLGSRDRLKALTAEFTTQIHPRYQQEHKESVQREALLDARGLAQVVVLFDDPAVETPVFVAHEFAMTDGAGHEYGPHSDGLRTAIEETDARLGTILDLLETKGLLDSTLFVFTADHGMASQDVSLRANPARHPERIGMKTIISEPMIWLRDLAVIVERAGDGRTGRVLVYDNDRGEEHPIAGAEVLVCVHPSETITGEPTAAARLATNEAGLAGFTTPADLPADRITIAVRHDAYNPRHLRLDGRNLAIDLRRELYGVDCPQ